MTRQSSAIGVALLLLCSLPLLAQRKAPPIAIRFQGAPEYTQQELLAAAGIKPDVLREQIRVASGKFLTEPNVTIVVKQVNSRKVFITGNVMMPDSYPLTGPRTVMQLIALAGGLTEYADSQNISIIRQDAGGQTRSLKFNYKDVSKGKKLEQNVVLQPGDTVVVP